MTEQLPGCRSFLCNLSLSKKLLLICGVSSFITLAGFCGISFYREWQSFVERRINSMESFALILEHNTVASLRFDDQSVTREYVDSLAPDEDIASATIYSPDGSVYAAFNRSDRAALEAPDFEGEKWIEGRLYFAHSVLFSDNQLLGKILIESDSKSYRAFVSKSLWTALALLLGGFAVTLLLASRMLSLVTRPIQDLVEITEKITHDEAFSERALKRYDDEVGRLVDRFNSMLDKISARDASLRELNSELEKKVDKRTEDLKTRNDALKEAMDAANAASVAKSEFLAITSHELRTPLNPIIGYVEKLQREDTDGKNKKELALIHQSAEQLLRLIDEILDFSRIERGKLKLNDDRVAYKELCRNVISLLEPQARSKGISLSYEDRLGPEDKDLLIVDEVRLRQIVLNLVNNAVKFTKEGSVSVRSVLDRFDEDGVKNLCIEVKDTGIGISEENKVHLFKPFSQIDGTWTREYGGMGLGLAISQKIVSAMGGTITCSSELGKGSLFTLDIPVQTLPNLATDDSTPSETIEESTIQEKAAEILLVEDEMVNRELMSALLSGLGHEVSIARNGLEALEWNEKKKFDFILLDISMPKMDGFEAAKRIRESNTSNRSIPIVAMTAHATPEDRAKCVKVGMSDFMSKPISFSKLKRTLAHWIGANQPS